MASITFQNYFRMYPKLSGMTGTAATEAAEFWDIYKMNVVEIPTNVPVQRIDEEDEFYKNTSDKFQAIAKADQGKAGHRPAGAGGHGIDREVGAAVRPSSTRKASSTRCSTPASTNRKRTSWRRPDASAR